MGTLDKDCTATYQPDVSGEINPANGSTNTDCAVDATGKPCPINPVNTACAPFQLSNNTDACIIDSYANEALNIGGAVLNVYKLLGVHEQNKLVDSTGRGAPISNGSRPGFPPENAFDIYTTKWQSIQRGPAVVASAYIGYDFGEIKTETFGTQVYSLDTSIFKHITAIGIKQSADASNRATKIRLEYSCDGKNWRGAGVSDLPDDNCLNTILLRSSVPSRYWRIRPLEFNGGDNDSWGVQAVQMFHEYIATKEDNIQDKLLLENRDRDYSTDPDILKCNYDLIDVTTELSRFGIELPSQSFYLTINFSACVAALGRPVIIGDILEMPSEAQFSATMDKIEKWLEVIDVAWSTEGYTPGWTPTLLRVVAQPAYASQETQDLFGDLSDVDADDTGYIDNSGLSDLFQDYSDVSETVKTEALQDVPEKGASGSSTVRAWEESEISSAEASGYPHLQRTGLNNTGLYVEDALPPNHKEYTEGDAYPLNPEHGDYHRMTYIGLSKDVPARLFRYSKPKARWVFLEKDKRAFYSDDKPTLQEFLKSPTKQEHTDILGQRNDTEDD